MHNKGLHILIASLLLWQVASAQNINNYQLTQNSHIGSLTDMSNSQQLIGNNQHDFASQVVNMGFDFIFMGKVYTSFSVNTNGVLRLGNEQILSTANTYGIPGNERIVPLAGVSVEYRNWWWWFSSEAYLKTNDDGKVHYKITGKAPDRMLVVEWENLGIDAGYGNSNTTFQVRLFESASNSSQSGTIEFVYDNFVLSSTYRNFQFRTGLGIGPENGNFAAIDHATNALTGQQNFLSGPVSDNSNYFTSTQANDKLLYRFESVKKPSGQFSNFELTCPAQNALTIGFNENSPDEAGMAVYRKKVSQNDKKFKFVKTLSPDARALIDGDITLGQKYVYRFYLLSEGHHADTYTEYTTEAMQTGGAFQAIASGNWTNKEIWGGKLPGSLDDIELGCSGSVFISVDQDIQIKSLSIESGSFLTVEDGVTLSVSGEFINNGVFNPIGNGRLVLNGSNAQSITNTGQGISDDTQFTAAGKATSWNSNQTGLVATKTIDVSGSDFSVIKSVTVDITHNYLRDLSIYLVAPNGQSFSLARGRGQQGQNYTKVVFTETGQPLPPTIQNVNLNGVYRPEESFANYMGPFTGTWTLQVNDGFTGTGGRLNSFELTLSKGSSNELVLTHLTIDNQSAEGVILNAGLIVQGSLQLTNGIIHTSDSAAMLLDAGAQSNEGSPTSFVDGPMLKRGNTAFTFPVGNAGKWAPATLENMRMANNNTTFKVAYFKRPCGNNNLLAPTIASVSGNEYWDIKPVVGSPTVDIVLHWKDAAFSNINDMITTGLVVAHFTNNLWNNEGGLVNFVPNLATLPGSIKASNINTFSPFTFGSEGEANALPVALVSFSGATKLDGTLLDWETASEVNNSHFEIQRSRDAQDWHTIGRVDGKGTTHIVQTYRFFDSQILNGICYYRLLQVDYDGQSEYSHVISFSRQNSENTFSVYPNPAREQVTVKSSTFPATLVLMTQDGKELLVQKVEAIQSTVQLPMLKDGIYILKLTNADGMQYQRLVIFGK